MEQQIVGGVLNRLRANLVSNRKEVDGLSYRLAIYNAPGEYEYLTEYRPLDNTVLFNGCNTVFVKGTITFPNEIRNDDDYEDYLFLQFHNLGGSIFIDGEPYNGIDSNRNKIPLRKEWAGQTKEILVEGYFLDYNVTTRQAYRPTCLDYCYFGRLDKKVEKYMFDLQLCNDWYRYDRDNPQDDNIHIRKLITAAFEDSIQYLDLYKTGDDFRNGVIEADNILCKKLDEIDDGDIRSHISLVASTHIDTAWLWQLKDTVRKCGHSFSNMLRLMDEYPEFIFSNSQAKLMSFTKEHYPALFEQIKQRQKEGRWENVGTMWVESDCNVTSGESMTRQILYGVNFFEKEFGSRPNMAWLPDTFGFQSNLPQIFKKSGTDYFYSYKLHWQAEEVFPYGNFRWKGIDGSEVIGSVINNPPGCYNGDPNPRQFREVKKVYEQEAEVDEIIFPYGWGDGGGGPTREMIEYAKRLGDFPGLPKSEISTAKHYFERLEQYRKDLPTWYGELYIQTHRGTLTTEGFVKKNNRRFENLFLQLEKLAVMAERNGAKPDWELLNKAWKDVLTLQFHDILPGSSIDEVYYDCETMYAEIYKMAGQFVESCGIDPKVDITKGITVVNTLSWKRDVLTSFTCCACAAAKGLSITKDGKVMPCSVVIDGDTATVTFLAKDIEGMSSADFEVVAGAVDGRTMCVTQDVNGITVDNATYHAVIDTAGRITSLFDKRVNRNVLRAPGNDVKYFLDGPQDEDAWNIYKNYKRREVKLYNTTSVSIGENNDLRTVIKVHNVGDKVDFRQDIIFYHDKDRIDFACDIDWHERGKVMRVYFPTTMNAPYFNSETGFGTYKRPTINSTKLEQAKFEVTAHRWIDLSETDYGVALLNDCKYAHDVQYDNIGLTLLRSTSSPAKFADIGNHKITYSLLPHVGSWEHAGVARAGIELNAESHAMGAIGKCDIAAGLFGCANENIIIDTVKKAENSDEVVVRLYESNGASGTAKLTVGKDVAASAECDLVERKIGEAPVVNGAIDFSFTPYEIKTFIIKF